jgi:phosphate uptake regulator
MDIRRVQQVASGTLLVSLPKEWCKRNQISRGSTVSLETGSDYSLILSPLRPGEKGPSEYVVELPAGDPAYVSNKITAAYLLGYDVVKVEGSGRMAYELRETVKKVLRQLVGLEIVEEDANSITAQYLLESGSLSPEKLFRRMHTLVAGMYRDVLDSILEDDKGLGKAAAERDDEVDRLYFLIVRVIRTAAGNLQLARKFNTTAVDLLDYRVAANMMEAVGDAAVEMLAKTPTTRRSLRPYRKDLIAATSVLEGLQDEAVKAFIKKHTDPPRRVVQLATEFKNVMNRIREAAIDGEDIPSLLQVTSSLEKISSYLLDIADLSSPLYPSVR